MPTRVFHVETVEPLVVGMQIELGATGNPQIDAIFETGMSLFGRDYLTRRAFINNEEPGTEIELVFELVRRASFYTHVDHDSRVERRFALKLDDTDDVKLFTKLPRRFTIAAPVGRYSPDFAILVDRDGTERLYLVRETKATRNLKDLDWDEEMRIRFARAHFAAAPSPPVSFDHTTDVDGLRLPPARPRRPSDPDDLAAPAEALA